MANGALEGLQRRIGSMRRLGSVVRTMKVLAAINSSQFARASEALRVYAATIEYGLTVVLRTLPEEVVLGERAANGPRGFILFGSDQGMCGSFNEQVLDFFLRTSGGEDGTCIVCGERLALIFPKGGMKVERAYGMPGSVERIIPFVSRIAGDIAAWQENGVGQVRLCGNRPLGQRYEPSATRIYPLAAAWLEELRSRPWPNRVIPTFTMDRGELFPGLLREYLFAELYRVCADSLAAENAARLAAMQGAEKNVDDRLVGLGREYNQVRQDAITEELLDIVSGYEALTKT